ncbi:MAG: T9SS type A sorting domain-containing protein [Ignavibacteriaceae bacterium]
MKRYFLFVVLLFLVNSNNFGQTFSDDFTGLTVATNLAGQSSWTKGGSGPDVTISNTTPLTYEGYNSGGAEYVVMGTPTGTSSRVYKTFATPVTSLANSTFYYSFLLNVSSAADNVTTKNYFMSLGVSGASTSYGAKLFTTANGTGYSMGLSKTTNTAVYGASVLEFNKTYLIVVRYTFHVSGIVAPEKYDDEAYLWVNPQGATEPLTSAAECTAVVAGTDTDFDGFGALTDVGNFVWHNRGLGNPVGAFDAVRVGYGTTSAGAWTDLNPGALPVELTSFTANNINGNVELLWKTATEKNNNGFDVERKSANSEFVKIGFVKGKGTTTDLSNYSFTDKNVKENYSYRLKQIDFDGTFAYSNIVNSSASTLPTTFAMAQNFPNPFNPSTSISYSLPKAGVVTLAIFNTLGQKVKEVVNGFQEVGNYTVSINASDLSSGNYIYNINLNGQSINKKMLLLK